MEGVSSLVEEKSLNVESDSSDHSFGVIGLESRWSRRCRLETGEIVELPLVDEVRMKIELRIQASSFICLKTRSLKFLWASSTS